MKKQEELRAARCHKSCRDRPASDRRPRLVGSIRVDSGRPSDTLRGLRTPRVEAFEFEYYPILLRERLPAIGIPLRQSDDDVPLDLQAMLNECCEEGRYVEDIDYSQQPDPPLEGDDISWADALLREQGRR